MTDRGFDGVLEHYRNPRNYGSIPAPDATAEDVNELCGDRVRFEVKLAGPEVRQVGFVGDGCAIMIASASILSERVTGIGVGRVEEISVEDVIAQLGAPVKPGRRQCVELPLKTLQRAVRGDSNP